MLEKQVTNKIELIRLRNRVDTFSAPNLREHYLEILDQGTNRFIIDLSEATFLDSAGLAALVQLLKRSRETNGDVKVILPDDENVLRIFRLTKFDQVFDIHPNVESASRAF